MVDVIKLIVEFVNNFLEVIFGFMLDIDLVEISEWLVFLKYVIKSKGLE